MGVKVVLPTVTRSTEVREYHNGCSLRYLLGFAQPDEPVSHYHTSHMSYFTLGDVTHAAIEDMLNYGTSLSDAIDKAQHDLITVIENSDETVYTTARPDAGATVQAVEDLLTDWYEDVMPGENQMSYYRALEYPPDTEVVMYDSEAEIESTADAIYAFVPDAIGNAGPYAIVDWKSGNGKKADSLQLHIYWYLMRKTKRVPRSAAFVGWFHHLTHRSVQHADPYPGDAYIEALIYKAHAYKSMRLWTPDPGWYCKYCPHYDTVCPLYNDVEYGDLMGGLDIQIVPGKLGES